MKKKPVKKKKHVHKWADEFPLCDHCGVYEAFCKGCQTVGVFNKKGELIDTAK